MSDTDHVRLERRDRVLRVSLDRPEKKNALTHAMYAALADAVAEAARDTGVRVVVIRGEGENFTAGNDLNDFAALNRGETSLEELPVVRLMREVVGFDKPLVAAVRGAAVGLGTTLLLHCDVVLAARSARFSMPFTRLGLVPEFGSSLLLPRTAGPVRAAHVLMTGEPFGVDEAAAMGIVSQVCEEAGLDREAEAVASRLASLPPGALRATKRLLRPPALREEVVEAILEEMRVFAERLASEEHREALTAFFEKRPPNFERFG